jgi:arylsulfatase A-like enzyme
MKYPVLLSILIVFVFLGCGSEKKTVPRRPNILILMSDNHSWNHLGCYGDPVIKTPTIDQLSENGLRFTNAYCSALGDPTGEV